MTAPSPTTSAALLDSARSGLVVIDPQERLLPAMRDPAALVTLIGRLMDGARLAGVPVLATEHCPDAIGPLEAGLRGRLSPLEIITKRHFAATNAPEFQAAIRALGPRDQIVLAGVEAHVCVAQTALGLLAEGRTVFLVVDAVGTRRAQDQEVAVARLRDAGAIPITLEMALFEWLGSADHPRFRDMLALVKAER